MCGFGNVIGTGIPAGALLTGAIASVIVAAGLNTNFFTSLGAPAPMALAGGLILGAMGALIAMGVLLQNAYRCANPSTDRCLTSLEIANAALAGLLATLTLQATACFALAGVAWIPWSIQASATILVIGLIPLLGTVATVVAAIARLESCLREPATGSTWGPVTVVSEIRGVVQWRTSTMEALRDNDLVDVDARGLGDGAGIAGATEGSPTRVGDVMQLPFVVRGAGLSVPVFVRVSGRAGAFRIGTRVSNAIEGRQIAGARPVTLTAAAPTQSDLVFELYELG